MSRFFIFKERASEFGYNSAMSDLSAKMCLLQLECCESPPTVPVAPPLQYYGYNSPYQIPQVMCPAGCTLCQQHLPPQDFYRPALALPMSYCSPNNSIYTQSNSTCVKSEFVDTIDSIDPNSNWQSDSGICSPFFDAPHDESQEVEDIGPGIAGIREAEVDAPKPVDEFLSRNMHIKWHVTFNDLFNKNCHMGTEWFLVPTCDPPTINRHKLFQYHDTAKVRFSCYDCGKSWTSVKGNVVFWISKDDVINRGFVLFKLYGQKCVECKPHFFEHAIWYEEEVERVLRNLYNKVIALYYGVAQAPRETNVRWARPRQPHDPDSCSACQDGICSHQRRFYTARGRQQKALQNAKHNSDHKSEHDHVGSKLTNKLDAKHVHSSIKTDTIVMPHDSTKSQFTSKVLNAPTRGIIRQRSVVIQ